MPVNALHAAAPEGAKSPAGSAAKMTDAARQFEALLIGEMLKTVHESGEDGGAASMVDISQQHLAQALASRGGFGIATMVVDGLKDARR